MFMYNLQCTDRYSTVNNSANNSMFQCKYECIVSDINEKKIWPNKRERRKKI